MRAFVAALSVIVCVCALSACAPTAQERAAPMTAIVRVVDGSATVTDADGAVVSPTDKQSLGAGTRIEATGETAMVELVWPDGAVTRLGPETTFVVGGLDAVDSARGVQAGGVTWNREPAATPAATPASPYGIRVEGAIVGDLGPFFVVDCRHAGCRVAATGGTGGDGSLTTFRRAGVDTVSAAARPATWGEIFGDPWATRNAELDEKEGFSSVTDAFANADASRAAFTGTFSSVVTSTAVNCTGGGCASYHLGSVGKSRTFTYTFSQDCSQGIPCRPVVDTQYTDLATGATGDRTLDLRFDGDAYSWGYTDKVALCIWSYQDGTKAETGRGDNTIAWRVQPTEAKMINGEFVVTALSGDVTSGTKIITRTDRKKFPGCEYWEVQWSTSATMELSRADG